MRGQPGGRVTAAQIAVQAGVSVPTVSKVLNRRSGVAPETRRKIEALLDQHNYVRRVGRLAHSAGLIDLVFDGFDTPWVLEVLEGVEEGLRGSGRAVVVTGGHSDPQGARAWLENLSVRPSDGVIMAVAALTGRQRSQLDSLGLPFVVIDPVGQLDPNVMSVGAANYTGGLAATEHLLSLGHRRIAMIGGPPHMLFSRARTDAYRSALLDAGVPVDPELITTGDCRTEDGYRQATRLFALPEPPTAIFAASDQQATGVYDAARDHGLSIPDDLSVVGFDDLPSASWLRPRLTTVRQPIRAMAATAADMLLKRIDADGPSSSRVELATQLVVRESTRSVVEASRG